MALTYSTTPSISQRSRVSLRRVRRGVIATLVTLVSAILVLLYIAPLFYGIVESLGTGSSYEGAPLYPVKPRSVNLNGTSYDLYKVPIDGQIRELAMIDSGRKKSTFIDPNTPDTPIEWEGRWRTLPRVFDFAPQWGNYPEAWKAIRFGRLLLNTFLVSFFAMIGTVLSGIIVAYGFARFRVPGKGVLEMILMSTIILPPQITIVPTYALFHKLGWVGTWLPLIVPTFFGSAYGIFLLRQFFMTIPMELDEAAKMDGASPLRILTSIIVPLSYPSIIAVALFQFVASWNDFFYPLLYLAGKNDLMTLSPALQQFSSVYGTSKPHFISAAAMLTTAFPLLLFLLAQRPFMRGVMMPGLDK
jgi:multiple sugar transport system permease protein